MKRLFLPLLCAAAILTATAAPAPLTFDSLRSGYLTPAQISAIKSSKLVYLVSTEGESDARLVIRSQRPAMLRIDVISPEDSYAACHNGQSAWGYTQKDGFYDLSKEEIAEMHHDADFLPIPIDNKPAFADPVAQGEEQADGVLCSRYETRSLSDKNLKIVLWIDKATSLLRKIEAEDANSKTVTILRDYKVVNGVKLATRIYVSDSDGFHTMTLQSATWNPVFAANLFVKPTAAAGLQVAVTKTPANFTAAPPVRRNGSPDEISKLKKKIAKLEILIKDNENKLSVLEKVIGSDREHMTTLAATKTPVRYRSAWTRYGFITRRTTFTSGKRTRHRMYNKLNRESNKAMKNYVAINRELVRYRIQLSEAKMQLEQISGK